MSGIGFDHITDHNSGRLAFLSGCSAAGSAPGLGIPINSAMMLKRPTG